MLSVALLAIGALALVEKIEFQIKRDREEEMIHRGVQYSRAVRRYFKKFGRYPSRIEELESTNNIRFLRQRYKDPITGKDFKPLHMMCRCHSGRASAQGSEGLLPDKPGALPALLRARRELVLCRLRVMRPTMHPRLEDRVRLAVPPPLGTRV
jgi:hypothetical protein